ncbi:MAG: hypothetical protein KIT80_12335 [Chitinophagaceae bacterium]|nr:hypothetical protein [Chitinophagaceae bacterium]MCW5927691.1 hypothetical protein [Chitinophagaceae bacterium]
MFYLQKHIAITLMALVLLKMVSGPLTFLQYQLNKSYVAANLCENRYRPQLQCEGKCLLMKKLEKQHDTDTQEKNSSVIIVAEYFINTDMLPAAFMCTAATGNHFTYYTLDYTPEYYHVIFHPPA